ncbi:MAG: hypothetical protein HY754_06485 [Nitrospirae bacterium]|nr:hypothetical protein [Nitrospirota bacterium]
MYDPMQGVEARGSEVVNSSKEPAPVYKTGWGNEIVDKDLFSPTRTYVQPQPKSLVPVKPVELPKRPEVNLRGIVFDQYGDYIAYLEKDRAKPVPVRKGDKLDDIEVVDVKQRSVELRWNEETISLSLDKIKTIKNPRSGK